jgi:ferric enterobactin receptor
MNQNFKKSLLFIIAIQVFFCTVMNAQVKPNTKISGKVFDKSTNQPLEYATISIINKQTGKTVNGSIADAKGAFGIPDVPYGTYKVNIEFIGYEKSTIEDVIVSSEKRSVVLGTISLASSTHNLQNVEVVGDKPVVENKIDKIVYNASNDISSQGGAAIDVLKKVPQVTVDVDGNVELQGNANIRFLINGKPSSVFGSNLADALASIPASQIKSIEAITNPGAKYDSQGTGGIINIILYDNKMQGANGNINLTAGSRMENGSVNLNLRHNNFGVNGFFGGNAQITSKMPNTQNRLSTDSVTSTRTSLYQESVSDFQRHGFRSGAGFDWDITKNDIVTGSFGYNQFGNTSSGLTNQDQLTKDFLSNPVSDILTTRNSVSQSTISSMDWSLDYKKKFKKEGQELDFMYHASNGTPNSSYTQTQIYNGESLPYMGSTSTNPGTDKQTEIAIDYSHPVSKNFTVETGVKTTIENLKSIANVSDYNPAIDQFLPDALQSYQLNYTMKVYAGYLSTSFPVFHYINVKAGARYEYTDVSIDFPNTTIPAYGTLVPSIVLSHNLNKTQSIKLAYSKRIERPGYRQLNPFVNLSDPYNISIGNPLLKPEIGNNLELGYSATFKKGGNLYFALIERINTQDVKQMTAFYPTYQIGDSIYNNVSVTNSQNIGSEYNSGFSASGSYPITKKLNIRGNLMVTHRYIVSSLTGNQSTGLRSRLNMNVTYQLPKNLVIDFFGMYSAPANNIQGKIPQFFIYNFAFRKLFWDKNGSLGFTALNPFSKYVRQVTTINTENYTSNSIRELPIRSFGISFTYKFGKIEFKKTKEEDENSYMKDSPQGGS